MEPYTVTAVMYHFLMRTRRVQSFLFPEGMHTHVVALWAMESQNNLWLINRRLLTSSDST